MSLAAALLTPIPGQTSVEVIDGTNARRITRRFDAPIDLLENSARLTEVCEPYGTADGVAVGAANTRRTPLAAKVWGTAYLVELRAVPKTDTEGKGAPEKCLVEKIYEQTPYTRSSETQYDAAGAITGTVDTVVLAFGQTYTPGAGEVVLSGSSSEFGRIIMRVRRVTVSGADGAGGISDTGVNGAVKLETKTKFSSDKPGAPTGTDVTQYAQSPESGYWRDSVERATIVEAQPMEGEDEVNGATKLTATEALSTTKPADPAGTNVTDFRKTKENGFWRMTKRLVSIVEAQPMKGADEVNGATKLTATEDLSTTKPADPGDTNVTDFRVVKENGFWRLTKRIVDIVEAQPTKGADEVNGATKLTATEDLSTTKPADPTDTNVTDFRVVKENGFWRLTKRIVDIVEAQPANGDEEVNGPFKFTTTENLSTAKPADPAGDDVMSFRVVKENGFWRLVKRLVSIVVSRYRKGFTEDGEGVVYESGTEAFVTEPADPTTGVYEEWVKEKRGEGWVVNWRKVADAQLAAPTDRERRTKESRPDGSVMEVVTQSGTAPACTTELTGTVIQVREARVKRSGGIQTLTKGWLKLPAGRTENVLVRWSRPGLATLGGTIGPSGDAYLRIEPGVDQRIPGTVVCAWSTDGTVTAPWKVDYWFSFYLGGTLADGTPFARQETHPGVLGDVTIAGSGGKWNGVDLETIAGSGYSSPSTRPTGSQVLDCEVQPYAADINGTVYFEKRTTSAVVS